MNVLVLPGRYVQFWKHEKIKWAVWKAAVQQKEKGCGAIRDFEPGRWVAAKQCIFGHF